MFGGEEEGPSSSSSSSESEILQRWKEIQYSLKQRLIINDDFTWKLPSSESVSTSHGDDQSELKYIGGVDVSCLKDDQSVACGTIVVLDFHSGKVVYHDSAHLTLHVPYKAGFLAFREAPVLLQLLQKMKNDNSPYYPQLLMVDGNGILHPRGFGLACHLGVLENIPTIGIGKNLHCIDGLTEKGVRKCLLDRERSGEDFMTLTGRSGSIHGVAMRSTEGSIKPIFISIGHRVSLDTAVKIVKMTCKYRVPEPIRQADLKSRKCIRENKSTLSTLLISGLTDVYDSVGSQIHHGDSLPPFYKARSTLVLEEMARARKIGTPTEFASLSVAPPPPAAISAPSARHSPRPEFQRGGYSNRGGRHGGGRNCGRGGRHKGGRHSGRQSYHWQQAPWGYSSHWAGTPSWGYPPCPYPTQPWTAPHPRGSSQPGLLGLRPRAPQAHLVETSHEYFPTDINEAMHTMTINSPPEP